MQADKIVCPAPIPMLVWKGFNAKGSVFDDLKLLPCGRYKDTDGASEKLARKNPPQAMEHSIFFGKCGGDPIAGTQADKCSRLSNAIGFHLQVQAADQGRPADSDRCSCDVRPDYRSQYEILLDHLPAAVDSRPRGLGLHGKRDKQYQQNATTLHAPLSIPPGPIPAK